MQSRNVTLPELFLIAGTRVALGIGIGFLVADRINDDARRGAGWALLGIGALTTIPIVANIIAKRPAVSELVPQRIAR